MRLAHRNVHPNQIKVGPNGRFLARPEVAKVFAPPSLVREKRLASGNHFDGLCSLCLVAVALEPQLQI